MTCVWTVGHSNRSFEEFVGLLEREAISLLVDVRRFAGSRKHPQFGSDLFPGLLGERGIGYRHMLELGGRRSTTEPTDDEIAGAWRNVSFRAYAQHTRSPGFEHAIDELVDIAAGARVAICCSEAVPWRCHRWIISDVLVARDCDVLHIIGDRAARPHVLNPFARVRGNRVAWPAAGSSADASDQDSGRLQQLKR